MADSIRVFCRVRPLNHNETTNDTVIDVSDDLSQIIVKEGASTASRSGGMGSPMLSPKAAPRASLMPSTPSTSNSSNFSFDKAWPSLTSQHDVFESAGRPMVADLIDGYNCTVFAYGQTGSGKTFTMMGCDEDPVVDTDPSDQKTSFSLPTTSSLHGIIPRLVASLFDAIDETDNSVEFTIKFSMVEIYNEKIRDLLNPSRDNLKVREAQAGVWIEDVTECYAISEEDVFSYISVGTANRSVGSTNMNEQSSRSHSVVVITVGQNNLLTGEKRGGKLTLVDLAGSEKVVKTGAEGSRLKEAQHINKSLSALGNVINALTSGSSHIPYRDSKLTRLLTDSLGGNSKTALIITCSPASSNLEETLSTLRFGRRAKNIKNRPIKNRERSIEEYKRLLAEAVRKVEDQSFLIEKLKNALLMFVDESHPLYHDLTNAATLADSVNFLSSLASGSTPEMSSDSGKEFDSVSRKLDFSDDVLFAGVEKDVERLQELENQLAALKDELDQTLNEVGSLRSDISQKERLLAQKDIKLEEAACALAAAEARSEELLVKVKSGGADATTRIAALEDRLRAAGDIAMEHEGELEALRASVGAKSRFLEDTMQRLNLAEKNLVEARKSIAESNERADREMAEKNALEKALSSLGGKLATKDEQRMELMEQVDLLRDQIAHMESQLTNQIDRGKESAANVQERNNLKSQVTSLQVELQNTKSKLLQSTEEISILKGQNDVLNQDVTKLRDSSALLEERVQDLDQSLEQAKLAVEEALQQSKLYQLSAEEANELVAKLKAQLAQLELDADEKLSKLQSSFDQLQIDLEKAIENSALVETLRAEIDALTNASLQKDTQLQVIEKELLQTTNSLTDMTSKLNEAEENNRDEELRQQILELQAIKSDFTQKLEDAQSQIVQYQSDVASWKESCESLRAESDTNLQNHNTQRDLAENLQAQLTKNIQLHEELTQKVLSLENDLGKETSKSSELSGLLSEQRDANQQLDLSWKDAGMEIKKLVAKLSEHQSVIDSLGKELEEEKLRAKQLLDSEDKSNAVTNQLTEKIEKKELQIDALRKELERIQTLLEDEYEEQSKLKSKLESVSSELAKEKELAMHNAEEHISNTQSLQNMLEELKSTIHNHEASIAALSHDLQEKTSLLVEKEEHISKLQSDVEALQSELGTQHDQVSALKQDLETQKTLVAEHIASIATLESNSSELQSELDAKNLSLGQSVASVADLEAKLQSSLDKCTSLQSELDTLRSTANTDVLGFQDKIAQLEQELSLSETNRQNIADEKDQLEKELNLLRDTYNTLQSDLKSSQELVESLREELSTVTTQSQDAIRQQDQEHKSTIDSLNETIGTLRTNLEQSQSTQSCLETEIEELKFQRDEALEKLRFETETLEETQNANATLQADLNALRTEKSKFESATMLAAEKSESLLEVERQRAEKAETLCTASNALADSRLDSLTESQAKILELEGELAKLQNTISHHQEELALATQREVREKANREKDREAMESEKSQLRNSLAAITEEKEKEIASLSKESWELSMLREVVAKLRQEKDALADIAAAAEAEKTKFSALLSRANDQIASHQLQWEKQITQQLEHERVMQQRLWEATNATTTKTRGKDTKDKALTVPFAEYSALEHSFTLQTSQLRDKFIETQAEIAKNAGFEKKIGELEEDLKNALSDEASAKLFDENRVLRARTKELQEVNHKLLMQGQEHRSRVVGRKGSMSVSPSALGATTVVRSPSNNTNNTNNAQPNDQESKTIVVEEVDEFDLIVGQRGRSIVVTPEQQQQQQDDIFQARISPSSDVPTVKGKGETKSKGLFSKFF